ncbi:bifunctional alpha,alpha-trehalose-phosphate synthase (UDP-forming)/trehalose-phosphatase [Thermodesulfobacterium hydrogeniphilum]|uniref:bifunctional alpha,alpha-trehalose-phosphate synthase (UDP-forming)/trehalose-phosphatase n=1 Tax=Thermodesulfobacterium hydrogeniphilum TaxID=161156 RepID=UPI0005715395|nr:bifunctional alpha,alpha-trehalose-phosphate synthase (UDP-forming)/trehalose-phosphatase [Thermodesulfobacterium hydrogeniphilum]
MNFFNEKLIIVANRLPFSVKKDLTFVKSPGGLVSGLETFLKKSNINNYTWIGWPGSHFDKKKFEIIKEKSKDINCYPVSVPAKLLDKFYNGFCNKTLWPLFHSFPSYVVYEETYWNSYVTVNQIFFEETVKHVDENSIVWIHDYHLMLLPSLLREKFPNIMLGFFLHIPFPPPEVFMQLPWRREILVGLLGCDLIGFHTYEYTTNFLRSLSRTLGIDHKMGDILYKNRLVKVDTFPMGIDFDLFFNACENENVKSILKTIQYQLKDKRIIFSVDRLDYTKGIYNRLLAFEDLLIRRPDLRGKVVLIMVVVPSREGVEHYQRMKKQLEEKISEINGKFGKIDWVPVLYYYRSLNFEELTAHYLACNAILVTPLKDGMNLIAKEFVASRKDLKGVIILSEFAGSAKELGEALIVNPNSISELSYAIEKAIEMPREEQKERLSIMQERLRRYDIVKWGQDFFNTLKYLIETKEKLNTKFLNEAIIHQIKEKFQRASNRILFLDYDGTLVAIVSKPSLAIPDREIKNLLEQISNLPNTDIVIISGRKKEDLVRWFSGIKVNFISEHGIFIKKYNSDWEPMVNISPDFKEPIRNIMEIYVDRLPQSFIEEKEFSIVFHYRNADPELASLRVAELIDELLILTGNMQANVLLGNKVVEVRPAGIDKGVAANIFLKEKNYDFILAIGDDITDEDLFRALPEEAITIKVGLGKSLAKYSAKSYKDVRKLLKNLVE